MIQKTPNISLVKHFDVVSKSKSNVHLHVFKFCIGTFYFYFGSVCQGGSFRN